MEWLTVENVENWLSLAAQVVGVAALLATLTPNTSDNAIVDTILRVINFFGANFGKAKNDPADGR